MAFDWFASLPNLITIGRLLLTPLVIVMIVYGDWSVAFALFATASLSDALDGWLARSFRLQSELGAVLDPLADKALIVSVYVTLAIQGVLPPWLAIMVVSRDLLIIGAVAVAWLVSRPFEVRPHPVSKATTLFQLVLAGAALAIQVFRWRFPALEVALLGLVCALTIASASVYLWFWIKHMRP
mgnify:CR=1 FL=1